MKKILQVVVCDDYRQAFQYYTIVDLVVATNACVFPETASSRLPHVAKLKTLGSRVHEWLSSVLSLASDGG